MADLATQAADAIEQAVSTVRDRTVVPARAATKALVYGLLSSFFVLTALTLLAIGLFRGLTELTDKVWISYFIVGGVLVIAGAILWANRGPRARRAA